MDDHPGEKARFVFSAGPQGESAHNQRMYQKKERARNPDQVGNRVTVPMLEDVIKWLVPFLCGSAVSTILTYVTWFRALRGGVQCLLRAELIRCHEKYMALGSCPVHVKEAAKREYNAYRALGGNDVATELYHQILGLPSSEEG